MSSSITDFLYTHGLSPTLINPPQAAWKMLEHMKAGLAGKPVDMPMIPTYIYADGEIEKNKPVIVIDAGGTNYRSALAVFRDSGCELSNLKVGKMPGTGEAVEWSRFISYVADSIEDIINETDIIGFCFSYNVEITPEIDGIVKRIDKEVVIKNSEGQLIGASLAAELEKRGYPGKKVIILNDTVAALLGGISSADKNDFSGLAGMICGTGVNTCCALQTEKIGKVPDCRKGKMLINLESGLFNSFPLGDIDKLVDAESNNPGEKIMEKMSSGVYLGTICRKAIEVAAEEGYLDKSCLRKIENIEKFDAAVPDAWASGEDPYGIFAGEELEFIRGLAHALFERSAKCMCTNIIAIMLLLEKGQDPEKPVCVCAEGSLIGKSRYFRPMLEKCLRFYAEGTLSLHCSLLIGKDTTLPGAAAAALLNA